MSVPASPPPPLKVDACGAVTAEWKDKIERTLSLIEKSNSPSEAATLYTLLSRVLENVIKDSSKETLRRFHLDSASFQKQIGDVKASLALLHTIGYQRKVVKEKPALVLHEPVGGDLMFLRHCVAILSAAAARLSSAVAASLVGGPAPAHMEAAPGPKPVAKASPVAPDPVIYMSAAPPSMFGASASKPAGSGGGGGSGGGSDMKSDSKMYMSIGSNAHLPPPGISGSGTVSASGSGSGSGTGTGTGSGSGSGSAGSAGGHSPQFGAMSASAHAFKGMDDAEAAELKAAMDRFAAEDKAARETARKAAMAADEEMARKLAQEMASDSASSRAAARAAEEASSAKLIAELQAQEAKAAAVRKDEQLVRALESDNQLKKFLREQIKSGVRIELEQFNLLNLNDDNATKPDRKWDCIVCFEKFALNKILVLGCRHLLCLNCTKEYLTSEINEGKAEKLKCSVPTCKHRVTALEIAYACDKKTVAKWNDLLFDAALRQDPNARWCPHKGCGTPMLGSKEHPMLVCPKCKFKFCFNCQTDDWHTGSTCANYQKWKAENKSGDTKYERYISQHTKKCPKCKVHIEKNEGCDHMSCRCGYQFYWSTLKKYP